jgi:chromosome segregation ATPase
MCGTELKLLNYKEWGAKEFDQLLAVVNSPQNTWKVDNIKLFVESILKEDKIDVQPLEKTKQAYLSEESTTPNTPRDKTFSQMRLQLANIEAEFVLHRENTKQTISELSQSIETKDKEIVSLKNTEKEKQQIISDMTLKLLQMEENINALKKRCKKIEEKNSNLQQSVHKPKDT